MSSKHNPQDAQEASNPLLRSAIIDAVRFDEREPRDPPSPAPSPVPSDDERSERSTADPYFDGDVPVHTKGFTGLEEPPSGNVVLAIVDCDSANPSHPSSTNDDAGTLEWPDAEGENRMLVAATLEVAGKIQSAFSGQSPFVDNVMTGVSNTLNVVQTVLETDGVVSSVENAVASVSQGGSTGAVVGDVAGAVDAVADAVAAATQNSGGKLGQFVHNVATVVGSVAGVVPSIANTVVNAIEAVSNLTDKKKDKKKKKKSAPISNKRALLVGINYGGTGHDLSGCISDVNSVYDYLTGTVGFAPSDIVTLVDEPAVHTGPSIVLPTRANIVAAFRDLTSWALQTLATNGNQPLEIFFQYSGHGTDVPDRSGDEIDGRDECLAPCDFATAGFLSDDEVYALLFKPLGTLDAGRNLINVVCLIDACRSGTIGDLPLNWKSGNAFAYSNALAWKRARGNYEAYIKSFGPLPRVAMLSGCRDDQYSTDLGRNGGALTTTLLGYLLANRGRSPSWSETMNYLASSLKKYGQTPDLSTSFPLDVSVAFGKSLGSAKRPVVSGATRTLFSDEESEDGASEDIPTYDVTDSDEEEEEDEAEAEEKEVDKPSVVTFVAGDKNEDDYLTRILLNIAKYQDLKRVVVCEFAPSNKILPSSSSS